MRTEPQASRRPTLRRLYTCLLSAYGPQGWWPLLNHDGSNPTKTGSISGYHPNDHSFPHDERERFEICIGAILTQNTAWTNVEKALRNLDALRAIDPVRLLALHPATLRKAIRPAGYYNQKAKKLRIFAVFHSGLQGRTPTRDELLALWGIGPETADSILLYAYGVPTFVIDTYTRRILASLRLAKADADYDDLQSLFSRQLPDDSALYNEYHALLVEHAKRLRNGSAHTFK